jgi:hypothetical protein
VPGERWWSVVVGDDRGQPDRVHRDAEAFGDQLGGVDSAVAEEDVERERRVDVADVQEVRLDVGNEELLEIERDPLGTLQADSFGEQLIEVLTGDLGRPVVGEAVHAERLDLRRIPRPGVPADVVTASGEVGGDAGQRVEVAVGGQRREQQSH